VLDASLKRRSPDLAQCIVNPLALCGGVDRELDSHIELTAPQTAPFSLHSALLLTRALYYIGNRVPVGTQPCLVIHLGEDNCPDCF
jgi:hypothetical protein